MPVIHSCVGFKSIDVLKEDSECVCVFLSEWVHWISPWEIGFCCFICVKSGAVVDELGLSEMFCFVGGFLDDWCSVFFWDGFLG